MAEESTAQLDPLAPEGVGYRELEASGFPDKIAIAGKFP